MIEFYEDDHIELYHLKEDIGESVNLASKLPERASAMRLKLHHWQHEVGAQMPTVYAVRNERKQADPKRTTQ